jgi:hypothetical protein
MKTRSGAVNDIAEKSYLEYFNDFLTVERFAEYYEMPVSFAKELIDLGKSIHEEKEEKQFLDEVGSHERGLYLD